VGFAALAAAVRAQDGRGRPTVLATAVPAYFGLPDAMAVSIALHRGELSEARLVELPPLLFDAAREGDQAASDVVLRLAEEVTAFAGAAIRRLAVSGGDPDVVLGGGLLRAGLPLLDDAVRAGIEREAPRAAVVFVPSAPIVGAGLLALTEAGASPEAAERLSAALPDGSGHARTPDL
jgi:N-acetylglucosamine kinase-like BadF-type ATPase